MKPMEITACDCTTCNRPDCAHRDSYRRLPKDNGGLALCHRLTADSQTTTTADSEQDVHAAYTAMLRAFESAYSRGDYGVELYDLATAVARSVVKKCCDPQRKSATDRETVSASGMSPAMVKVRRGITADTLDLAHLRECANRATAWSYDKDGYVRVEVVDKNADKAVSALIAECLTDGVDIVQDACVALLEQAQEHATAPGWLEMPYTLRRLSTHVLIKDKDGAKWEDVETSPIREVYRAVRRSVQNSRAMQTDPRNGYLYLEDMTTDPETNAVETVYIRLGKWADLGGYEHSGHFPTDGATQYDRGGRYTADLQTVMDYNNVLQALNLTERQAQVVRLRMAGYGYYAIGSYLGVSFQAVQNTVARIRAKCEKVGFTPEMWEEMTAE